MDRIKKRLTILNAVIEAMIKTPETVKYPFGDLTLPEGYRGKIEFDTDKCIGCGKCKTLCPLNNIEIKKKRPLWNGNCTHCMACISYCPTEAIEYKTKTKNQSRYYIEKYIKARD